MFQIFSKMNSISDGKPKRYNWDGRDYYTIHNSEPQQQALGVVWVWRLLIRGIKMVLRPERGGLDDHFESPFGSAVANSFALHLLILLKYHSIRPNTDHSAASILHLLNHFHF